MIGVIVEARAQKLQKSAQKLRLGRLQFCMAANEISQLSLFSTVSKECRARDKGWHHDELFFARSQFLGINLSQRH